MTFIDLHNHLLFGVDDGAKTEKEMQQILDAAYLDGTRIICATPHFHPGFFSDNKRLTDEAFSKLRHYCAKYPDVRLYLGNELRYSENCFDWLESGECRTLNESRYLLVDFLENDDSQYIVKSLFKLFNAGYIPILAHAERYKKFHHDMREIQTLQAYGVIIQVDAQSPFGGWGAGCRWRSRRLFKNYCVDVVASDAHNTSTRPPQLRRCYDYIVKTCGKAYAHEILYNNPMNLLSNPDIGKE